MECWHRLKIDSCPHYEYDELPQYWKVCQQNPLAQTWLLNPVDPFKSELTRVFKYINSLMPIRYYVIFCKYQAAPNPIHHDNHGPNRKVESAINFVLYGEGSMRFYRTEGDGELTKGAVTTSPTTGSHVYTTHERQYCKQIDEWDGKGWALVNTAVPHDIKVTSPFRVLLTARNPDITWEKAIEMLSPIITER